MGDPKKNLVAEDKTENKPVEKTERSKTEEFIKLKDGQRIVDSSHIENLNREAQKYRELMQAQKAEQETALLEAGEYKKLAESLKVENDNFKKITSELSDNLTKKEAAANNWIAYEKKQEAEFVKLSENITEEQRRILSTIGNISDRKEMLNLILTKSKKAAPDLGLPQENKEESFSISDFFKSKKKNVRMF